MKTIAWFTLGMLLSISSLAQGNFQLTSFPQSATVNDLMVDSKDVVWIATDQGLWSYDKGTWTEFGTADGLPHQEVLCLEERDGSLWIGTDQKGLAVYDGNQWSAMTLTTSAPHDNITCISPKMSGKYYYGTQSGQVFAHNAINQTAELKNYDNRLGQITEIEETATDVLISLSHNGLILELKSLNFNLYIDQSSALPASKVWCGAIENNIAYDGTDQGLYMADFTNGAPPTILGTLTPDNSQLPGRSIRSIAIRDGIHWYGTDQGLARKEGNDWSVYTTSNSAIPGSIIHELAVDSKGQVWLVSDNQHLVTDAPQSTLGQSGQSIQKQASLFPNPARDIITIQHLSAEINYHYTLINLCGQVVEHAELASNHQLSLSEIPAGKYWLQLESDGAEPLHFSFVRYE